MAAPRPWVEAFAPATVSNLGPGFDCLGLALTDLGDTVRARRAGGGSVTLVEVTGDDGKLPTDCRNTAVVAAQALLRWRLPSLSTRHWSWACRRRRWSKLLAVQRR